MTIEEFHTDLLNQKLEKYGKSITKTDIDDIQKQLQQEPLSNNITILHTLTHDDFIPIKGNFKDTQQKKLLHYIKNNLITYFISHPI